ncbi:hypothetical protein DO97_04655 [Neosynechococcus sphagnicola sy1]|uniref:DUF1830 domain-containing protein n=1 Tax=Neosynechococcus sphagnicola sy1 TaxID=1497020 RepID=A0A098TKC8_9CYAN|nr:DUF1830 domain-containing protein [Neosynechococcus sphagnicola]KGF72785.1 hypothetical protein DO97_04655 [Neosynechococcus sphagnicola sy1]
MAQVLDPLPSSDAGQLLCCYVNATNKIQVVRITNVVNWYFERVVFPGQRLVFEAAPDAQLEIHSGMMASSILSDTIPCDRLCMYDELNASLETEATFDGIPAGEQLPGANDPSLKPKTATVLTAID